MKPVKVSIVVPTYNASNYLPAFCQSVMDQSMPDYEVLFGDDGSTDASLEAIRPFLADSRFRLIAFPRNAGVHHRTFQLLQMARGEYWAYPGSDDLLEPRFLESRLSTMEGDPDIVLAHGPGRYIDAEGNPIKGEWQDDHLPELGRRLAGVTSGEDSLRSLLQHNYINTPAVLIRKRSTDAIMPFYSPAWWWLVDYHLWILLAALDGGFHFDPEPLHSYRIHPQYNTQDTMRQGVRHSEGRLVPLLALGQAAGFSVSARRVWSDHRVLLYTAWIYRAARLHHRGLLNHWMLDAAKVASGYSIGRNVSIHAEILKEGVNLAKYHFSESTFRKKQLFDVSGIPHLDHALFRKAEFLNRG